MNEGAKLRQIMDARGVSQAALARKSDVGRAAVNRWLSTPKFNRVVWQKLRRALPAIGIDPNEIRADEEEGPYEDFVPMLQEWTDEQLSILWRIMNSSKNSKKQVLTFLTGVLRKFPK